MHFYKYTESLGKLHQWVAFFLYIYFEKFINFKVWSPLNNIMQKYVVNYISNEFIQRYIKNQIFKYTIKVSKKILLKYLQDTAGIENR